MSKVAIELASEKYGTSSVTAKPATKKAAKKKTVNKKPSKSK